MKIQAVFEAVDGAGFKIHDSIGKDLRIACNKGGARGFFSLAAARVCAKVVASIGVDLVVGGTLLTAAAARKKIDTTPPKLNN